jgi:hypothetical protein
MKSKFDLFSHTIFCDLTKKGKGNEKRKIDMKVKKTKKGKGKEKRN